MKYHLITTHWDEQKKALSIIRDEVFIQEQQVPAELEWDEFDVHCLHVLVTDNNKPIACGRIKPDGHIGRMAVLKEYRQQGIGRDILFTLIKHAKKNHLKKVYLHAQISALPFYQKQNFITCSETFMDAGIPHKTMEKNLEINTE